MDNLQEIKDRDTQLYLIEKNDFYWYPIFKDGLYDSYNFPLKDISFDIDGWRCYTSDAYSQLNDMPYIIRDFKKDVLFHFLKHDPKYLSLYQDHLIVNRVLKKFPYFLSSINDSSYKLQRFVFNTVDYNIKIKLIKGSPKCMKKYFSSLEYLEKWSHLEFINSIGIMDYN